MQRYEMLWNKTGHEYLAKDDDGEYVRFEDMEQMLRDLGNGITEHATDTVWYSPIQTAVERICEVLGIEQL